MYRLIPRIQPYAWGSATAFTDLLGLPATGGPQAELWLGAHPSLPADVVIDGSAPMEETRRQVQAAYSTLLSSASS